MTPELSSNWKKLQAQIQAASTPSSPAVKRKARESHGNSSSSSSQSQYQSKRQKRLHPPKQPPPPMGVAQSSKIDTVPAIGVSPSLALWADDNDISPEDIAEAYGLGIQDTKLVTAEAPRPNEGRAPGVRVGKYVAIDCEMVGVGDKGRAHALARASVVDFHGRQIYDSFVKPRQRVTNWRTDVSGVGPEHMATARRFDEVRAAMKEILKGRILVGHDVRHDLDVLELHHPPKAIRDTATFRGFREYATGNKPSLRTLAKELLGLDIHTGSHSSIEDARVAMLIFRRHKAALDTSYMNRYPNASTSQQGQKQQKKAKKNQSHRGSAHSASHGAFLGVQVS